MKLFGEEVRHTSTNSPLNVLQVENFDEIFFDVFEVELNDTKLPLEKISSYKGNPVVNLPIVVEGEEVLYPFVLIKGDSEILFNESNKDLPIDDEPFVLDYEEEGEIISESKQDILNEIKKAKEKATKAIRKSKLEEAVKLSETAKKNNKALQNTLEKARHNLVSEFLIISDKLKKEFVSESRQEYSDIKETLNNKIADIANNLESQLKQNFKDASKIFDNNIKTLVKDLYSETVYPKLEKELNDIAFQIVEKVEEIETTLDKKLDTKAEKTLVEGVSKELSAIQKANIELNDNINKGVNKALSRAGNVKTLVEKIDKEINEKISTELTNIENYFDERIQNIQEKTFDITEESRKYIIDLVNKSKRDLLEEIAKIPKEKPVEYIIESRSKDPEKVNLDKLKKEYDTIIHNKFENYKTDLRKYIAVYSGGGSVAQQFADGGVMNGNLVVVGSISASQYLGMESGGLQNPVDVLEFNESYNKTGLETIGSLYWNSTDKTLDLVHPNSVQQLGQELYIPVRNKSGSSIPNGTPVYINGRNGNRPTILPAKSDIESTSTVIGLITEDIDDNQDGFVTTYGYVRQIKTDYSGSGIWGNTWNEGDYLYVSKTTAGQLTNIEPPTPHHSDIIGKVGVVGGNGIGSILVNIRRHQTLESLSDINGSPLTESGQFAVWNNTLSSFDFDYNINDYLPLSGGTITGSLSTQSLSASSANIQNGLIVDSNTLVVDSVNNRVGIGTSSPTQTLDVNGTFNTSGNSTIGGTLITTGKITANGQGNVFDLTSNDVMTRDLVDYEAIVNGNQFAQMVLTGSQNSGTGASAGSNSTLGMFAQVSTTANTNSSCYTYDNIHTHNGYSGNPIRSDRGLEFFAHGVMLRVENNTNWVMRINFGVGIPIRVPPLAGVAASSSTRQWGVEFYYDGSNNVGRLYWYDTSIQYGTPFIIPNLTSANWPSMVYSIRMRQTSSGLLEIYMNSPTLGLGGTRLSNSPISSVNATWTSTLLYGRHINFECATAAAAAPTTGARIHCTRMFCKYN